MTHRARSLLLAFATLPLAGAAAAVDSPSTYPGCASRSVSVPWGGSVVVELQACHAFGLGLVSKPPRHGSASPDGAEPVEGYRYTHGGRAPAGGGRDRFIVLDDNSDTITVSVSIDPPVSAISVAPAALPAMQAGTAMRVVLAAEGGAAPYRYRLAAGALPPGLALATDGTLDGTPTARAAYAFDVAVQDAAGGTARRGFGGEVAPGALSVSPVSAKVPRGRPFRLALEAHGGVAPHRFQVEGTPRLPEGLRLSPDGVLSGTTLAAPGRHRVTLRITDASAGAGHYFELETFELQVLAPQAPATP